MKRISCALGFVMIASLMYAKAQTPATTNGSRSCTVDKTPLSEAEIATAKDEPGKALSLYRAAAAKDPEAVDARVGVVLAQLQQRRVAAAWTEANTFVQQHPGNADALTAMAIAALARGDIAEAKKGAMQALGADPCNARAIATVAQIEWMAGQGVTANKHAELAHRLSPLRFTNEVWARMKPTGERSAAYTDVTANLPEDAVESRADAAGLSVEERLFSQTGCTVTPANGTTVVPLKMMDPSYGSTRDAVGVEIKIDGHMERLRLGGGRGIRLTKKMAVSMGLKNEGTIYDRKNLNNSRAKLYFTRIPRLQIGDVVYQNCGAIVINEDLDIREQSVIPSSFFGDFLVTVDYARMEMSLEALPAVADHAGGGPPAWSSVLLDGVEKPSINGGSWGAQEAALPPRLRHWTPIYRRDSSLLAPTLIGPDKERLFEIDFGLSHSHVAPMTAKDAVPVKEYPGATGEQINALHGAKYAIQFGGIVQPVEVWDVNERVSYGGTLGLEALHQLSISIDFRDNLALFQHSRH